MPKFAKRYVLGVGYLDSNKLSVALFTKPNGGVFVKLKAPHLRLSGKNAPKYRLVLELVEDDTN